MFKFRFQKALEHKEDEEEKAKLEVQKKRAQLITEEQELETINVKINNIVTEYSNKKLNGFTINDLQTYEYFISKIKTEKENQIQKIKETENEIEKLEEIYFETRKERKILEKLKEKHLEKYNDIERKKEDKFIDELSNMMYNRRK